jgi:hypothetical protein
LLALVVVLALALSAHAPVLGAEKQAPGVRVSTLGLSRTVFSTIAPHKRDKRPVVARVLADGGLVLASTVEAAYWLDGNGRLTRLLVFPRSLGHFKVASLRDGGPPVFVGSTDSVGRKVLVVPSDGRSPWPLRFEGLRATFANVLGDAEFEVVTHHLNELLIYSPRGDLLRRVPAADYIWDFVVLNVNATPHDEIVTYQYQNRRDGTFIQVLDADGEHIRTWHEAKANRYSVSNWSAPAPSMVSVLDDVITERSPKGEILRRDTVPGLGSYRYAETGVLAGGIRLALVRSGSCPSRLLAFDASGALVYDEVLATYTALHVPSHGASEFFVGQRATIYRYRLGGEAATTGQPGKPPSGS